MIRKYHNSQTTDNPWHREEEPLNLNWCPVIVSRGDQTTTQPSRDTRGEFNNASARRALVDWYLSLFIMCKAGHQYNERPRALALLNLPQEDKPSKASSPLLPTKTTATLEWTQSNVHETQNNHADPHNGSNNKQKFNNNRTTTPEWTAAQATLRTVGSESPCRAELADPHSLFFNIIICGDFSKINTI